MSSRIIVLLIILVAGCISEAPTTTVKPPTTPELESTSTPPPEHYPESPRPTTTTTQAPITIKEPKIELTSIPAEGRVGMEITLKWRVSGTGLRAVHTAIHYGAESRPGMLGLDAGPGAAGYPSLTTEFASGDFVLPRDFTATITPTATGMIYLRAHAIIDGKNFWTDERAVSIKS